MEKPPTAPTAGRLERLLGGRAVALAIVALGIVLRVWQYASNQTLWMDEIALSRNILALPLSDLLFRPLYFDQIAPRGFLLVEKVVTQLFGPSELSLRLFPLLVSLVGLLLFWRLAERLLDGLAVPFAMLAFAIGIPLVKYTAEVKQYGLDATVAVGMLLLALDLRERESTTRRLWLYGLVGFAIVWFSQTAVLVLAGIGLAQAIEWLVSRDRRVFRALLITVPIWAAGCLLAVVAGLRSMTPATKTFMDEFWRDGFLPLPLQASVAASWFWNRWVQIFSDPWLLRYRWAPFFGVLALIGLIAIWRTRRPRALLLIGPLLIALVAAVAQQYPLRGRVGLYLIPILLLAVAAGVEQLRRMASLRSEALGAAVLALCLFPPVEAVVKSPPPYVMENYRPVFAYLREHRQPGDSVWVLWSFHSAAIFYGPRYGLERNDWRRGACDRNDARPFLRDLDRYRGVKRVWILANGLMPLRVARQSVRSYLSTIGTRQDSLFVPSLVFAPMSVELYDLSDTLRLRAATAETFHVDPMPTTPKPGCRDWSATPMPSRVNDLSGTREEQRVARQTGYDTATRNVESRTTSLASLVVSSP